MMLLGGLDHLHLTTPDLDRLLRFYGAVFEAPTILDRTEDGLRHALIDVGGGALLDVLEQPEGPRRLDRFGLSTPSREAFLEARRRVIAGGAEDGLIRDAGFLWTFHFRNPDGIEGEVVWRYAAKPTTAPPLRRDWAIVPAE